MNFVGRSPGVYVPESTTPPSIVPEVTISRLLLIGKLPWMSRNPQDHSSTWICNSWRDIINKAYSLEPKEGPAAVLELCNRIEWADKAPKSFLAPQFGDAVRRKFGIDFRTKELSEGGTGMEHKGPVGKTVGEPKPDADKMAIEKRFEQLAGHFALTFLALRTYFENGGGSVVVFDPMDNNKPGDDFNQKLLRDLDIGIICAPGRNKAFYGELLKVCASRDSDSEGDAFCFVLIDAPIDEDPQKPPAFPQQFDPAGHSSACFGPWLRQEIQVRDDSGDNGDLPKTKTVTQVLPPSPAVAGVFAACDAMYGPFRAAAGVQFAIKGNWELTEGLTDLEIGLKNEKGQNQLRQFGRGQRPVIWGARTLSQNIDLQYIPVTRVLLALRKAIKQALRSFVFYPNNSELRQWVYRMLYGYLEDRRRRGWLKGESADEAFAIKFPTSIQDEKSGILRVRIEVALARPAEFIEVEISQLQEFAA